MLFVDNDLNNHRTMKHVPSDHSLLVSAFEGRAGLELVDSQRPGVLITVLKHLVSRPARPCQS